MKKIKLCHCVTPKLVADKNGHAVCMGCSNYFNTEHWKKHHNKKSSIDLSKKKVGRNSMCPCGSGLKNKNCCGYKRK